MCSVAALGSISPRYFITLPVAAVGSRGALSLRCDGGCASSKWYLVDVFSFALADGVPHVVR